MSFLRSLLLSFVHFRFLPFNFFAHDFPLLFFASVCVFFLASRLFVAQFRVSKSLVVAVLLMMTQRTQRRRGWAFQQGLVGGGGLRKGHGFSLACFLATFLLSLLFRLKPETCLSECVCPGICMRLIPLAHTHTQTQTRTRTLECRSKEAKTETRNFLAKTFCSQ